MLYPDRSALSFCFQYPDLQHAVLIEGVLFNDGPKTHCDRSATLQDAGPAPRMPGKSDGNGALMRLAPVASMHWRDSVKACQIASAQSRVTHHSDLSAGCCEVLASVLSRLIAGQSWDDAVDLAPENSWPDAVKDIALGTWKGKPVEDISSTGFVVHTLEAAIWSVGTTDSFEAALVRAVNLGDDADTVGAVTGQIAGARYGAGAIPERWLSALAKADDLSRLAERLIAKR